MIPWVGLLELLFGGGGVIFLYGSSREMIDTSREFTELTVDPIFFGDGVPRGDGHPVMVLPGFLASDNYLRPLRGWLERMGYAPLASGLKRNTGRLVPLAAQVAERLAAAVREHGAPATIVGHSFGGVIARNVARQRPELVRQVITLGAPLRTDAAPLSPSIPLTAIYSRTDRMVRYPRALGPDAARNIEVTGSHCGMAVNAQIYRHLATLLQPPLQLSEERIQLGE
jgi:pimeloyl-ACP methyl ester carboxylesterase